MGRTALELSPFSAARSERQAAGAPNSGSRIPRDAAAIVAWVLLIGAGALLVQVTLVRPGIARLDAAPLHAAFDPHVEPWIVLPVLVALATVWTMRVSSRLSWRAVLGAAWGLSATWAVSLASIRGWHRISAPLGHPGEYLAVVPKITSLGAFLDHFVEHIRGYPVHVQGHPPGFVVIVWALRHVGLGGPLAVSLLCIAVGAASAPAALIVVREVAGDEWARRAMPFVAVSPAAIWIATSADAFYAGVGAWGVALVVVATGRSGRHSDVCALVGGLLFGMTAFLSYGLVLLALIPLVVAARRRRARPIVLAAIGALPVFVAFLAAGFWWVDGLVATRGRYAAGIASRRPYLVFLVANLSSLAIALGPATAVALRRLRDHGVGLVVGGALLAVTIADLSGMSKSEVERIWLPFMPFLLVAGGALVVSRTAGAPGVLPRVRGTGWLIAQAAVAILLESLVRTAW